MSLGFTIADAQAHAEKHGYKLEFKTTNTIGGTVVRGSGASEQDVSAGAEGATGLRSAKQPNKTEAEYGRILEAMKLRGEVFAYCYEGITLKWADMRYTPDWFVFYQPSWSDKGAPLAIKIIEVKGAHIWDRDIVRFKGARAAWPMFAFEMHQKKGGEWRRIH